MHSRHLPATPQIPLVNVYFGSNECDDRMAPWRSFLLFLRRLSTPWYQLEQSRRPQARLVVAVVLVASVA